MLSLRVGQRVIFSVERDAIGDHAVSLAPERRV
jgi:cold shock CspA family protein